MRHQYLGAIDAVPRQAHSCFVKSLDEESAGQRPLVAVVDDDESVRESLPDLLGEFGFDARPFASAAEFLVSDSLGQTKCLLLDIAMPGMTGFDLQRELKVRGQNIPIIFITAEKDDTVRRRALERGAVEFLLKPFSDTALLKALNTALGLA
jgi:FixJ family two-component response regulator